MTPRLNRPLKSSLLKNIQKQRNTSLEQQLKQRFTEGETQALTGYELRQHVFLGVVLNELTEGQALSRLRTDLLKLNQTEYAKLAGIGRKTLSDIENDRGNFSLGTMRKAYRPIGFTLGITPISLEFLLDAL